MDPRQDHYQVREEEEEEEEEERAYRSDPPRQNQIDALQGAARHVHQGSEDLAGETLGETLEELEEMWWIVKTKQIKGVQTRHRLQVVGCKKEIDQTTVVVVVVHHVQQLYQVKLQQEVSAAAAAAGAGAGA